MRKRARRMEMNGERWREEGREERTLEENPNGEWKKEFIEEGSEESRERK